LPAGFEGVSGRAVLWLPAGHGAPRLTYREYLTSPQHFINLVARLRPGVTVAHANAELAALGPRIPHETPPTRFRGLERGGAAARRRAHRRRAAAIVAADPGRRWLRAAGHLRERRDAAS